MGEIGCHQLTLILNSPPVMPVRVSALKSLLSTYDPDLKNFLINGFSIGFRIGFDGTSNPLLAPNLRSAEEQPEVLSSKLDKKWSAGCIVGPFSPPPFANFVSALRRHSQENPGRVQCPRPISNQLSTLSQPIRTITICWV